MCLLVASIAHATEYVIAKASDNVTIYVIDNEGSGAEYINTFVLTTKPTISELQSIGLPSNLWSILDQGDIVYDTRLIAAKNIINGCQSRINEDASYIKKTESDKIILIIIFIIFVLICLGVIIIKPY